MASQSVSLTSISLSSPQNFESKVFMMLASHRTSLAEVNLTL